MSTYWLAQGSDSRQSQSHDIFSNANLKEEYVVQLIKYVFLDVQCECQNHINVPQHKRTKQIMPACH